MNTQHSHRANNVMVQARAINSSEARRLAEFYPDSDWDVEMRYDYRTAEYTPTVTGEIWLGDIPDWEGMIDEPCEVTERQVRMRKVLVDKVVRGVRYIVFISASRRLYEEERETLRMVGTLVSETTQTPAREEVREYLACRF